MAILEIALLAGVLFSAVGILSARQTFVAVAAYMVFSLLLAILWGLLYGARLAMAELGIGVVVTGLLFYMVDRRLHEKRGQKDE